MKTKMFTLALVVAFCGAAFATTLTTEAGRINSNVVGDTPKPDGSQCLSIDSGNIVNAWGWLEGYEYHIAASHFLQYGGIIDSAWVTLTDWRGSVDHNFDMTIWEDADNDGVPDNVIYTEYKDEIVGDWPDVTRHWIYPNIPVTEGWYWIGFTSRNNTFQGGCIDEAEDYPDQNWYWDGSNWYSGDLYGGDHCMGICYTWEQPDLELFCGGETWTCPGSGYDFYLEVINNTAFAITVPVHLTVFQGHGCISAPIITVSRTVTFEVGLRRYYYYFDVPENAPVGPYSALISFNYDGEYYSCCITPIDVLDCGPW